MARDRQAARGHRTSGLLKQDEGEGANKSSHLDLCQSLPHAAWEQAPEQQALPTAPGQAKHETRKALVKAFSLIKIFKSSQLLGHKILSSDLHPKAPSF